jgi:hypothetical protein
LLDIKLDDDTHHPWYVGDAILDYKGRMVVDIYADGHELQYIREKFQHLPDVPNSPVMFWCGDTARFIYHNL